MTVRLELIRHLVCGGDAFLYLGPRAGEDMMASRARRLDGGPIAPNTVMVCESCEGPVDLLDLEW